VTLLNQRPCTSSGLTRRALLRGGTLLLLSASCEVPANDADTSGPILRIGLVTDLHYAEKPHAGKRYYRESMAKLAEAVERFRREQVDFIVELGDFIDSTESPDQDLQNLQKIKAALDAARHPAHFVLGNHCVETLTKEEFLAAVGAKDAFYSFDQGPMHFIVLDSCFRSNGEPYGRNNVDWTDANLPADQLAWLRNDLARNASRPTIVFAHQRLDNAHRYSVKNAQAVRTVLERSGNVQAVLQGHSHRNDYQEIGGIHYCTVQAMVEGSGPENSGYSVVEVRRSGTITVTGFRKQSSYVWKA
jgi:3',5'-cyclic AMP phosphodiesterase CpdA